MTLTLSQGQPVTDQLFRCLECEGALRFGEAELTCNECGTTWPLKDGIPSFIDVPYWGEVSKDSMQEFNSQASELGWREAVDLRYAEKKPDYVTYITDLNRSTWTTALPVSPDATVLDVGSGLGAIVHGLALTYANVVSVEGVAERVKFQQIRLQQEGIENVQLTQASILDLPFFPETFDLIVLNGVVEWIGEWDVQGTPREAQVRALQGVLRLLKPGGVVMVGIENRWGYNSFFGRIDHSGLPYTQLMPRWMATRALRRKNFEHYRTTLNRKAEYRTYTYGQRGYHRLLRDAGFEIESTFLPYPGYNLPFRFFANDNPRPFSRLIARGIAWGSVQRRQTGWKQRLKFKISDTDFFAKFPPDFLFVASRPGATNPDVETRLPLPDAVGKRLGDEQPQGRIRVLGLESTSQRNKRVLTLTDERGGLRWVAKVINRNLPHEKGLDAEEKVLLQLRELLGGTDYENVVPRMISHFEHGPWEVLLESALRGLPLDYVISSKLLLGKDLLTPLSRVTDFVVGLGAALNSKERSQKVELPAWTWDAVPQRARDEISDLEGRMADLPRWIQHGDLFVSNLYWDQESQSVQAIDWEDLGHYPALFDLFSFWTTAWDIDLVWRGPREAGTSDLTRFEELYFAESTISEHVCKLARRACESSKLDPGKLPLLFLAYLLTFTEKLRARGSEASMERYQARVKYLLENRSKLRLGPLS